MICIHCASCSWLDEYEMGEAVGGGDLCEDCEAQVYRDDHEEEEGNA